MSQGRGTTPETTPETTPAITPDLTPGSLAGTVVVDLSRALAGPHAAMMLADLGARVIKVELPHTGDETRQWGPPFVEDAEAEHRVATYFLACNRNKESIALDLKDEADREVLLGLLRRADVLVENFRPGVLDRLGLSTAVLAELNPGLVTLSISGFGHDGPEGGRAGYDQIAQGEAGLMSLTGPGPDQPQRVGTPIGDVLAGMYGAFGVAAALVERDRTGRGTVVRTSLLAAIVGAHAHQGTRHTVAGQLPQAQGNHHSSISPYGLFRCADGAVQIAAANPSLWQRLCAVLELDPEHPAMASNADRVTHRDQVTAAIEAALASMTREEALARFEAAGIPAGRVRTLEEVYAWDQTRSQGLLIDVAHPDLGPMQLPGPPLRMFRAEAGGETEVTRTAHTAPPRLDADAAAVRAFARAADPR